MSSSSQEETRLLLPIIDSHIHIYPESEVPNLAWCTPDHPLSGQFSLDQFKRAARSAPSLLGFVFVETDRKHDLAAITAPSSTPADRDAAWEGPLREVRWLRRVALGTPLPGEGHSPEDKHLCLAIVPWAPLPAGEAVLAEYLARVQEEAGEAWPKIKGFRYLLQDKPHGTMLEDKFIEGLKYLGKRGFSFEVGIDQHRRGRKQLEETVEMIGRAHEGVPDEDKVTFIISQFYLSLSFPSPNTPQTTTLRCTCSLANYTPCHHHQQTTSASQISQFTTSPPTPPSPPGAPQSSPSGNAPAPT